MQESGGRGTDPMQCSESPYNTRFSHSPGSITDPNYSIEVGVQTFADCISQAGCSSPQDMDKLRVLKTYMIITNIKEFREQNKMSQTELAQLVGVRRETIGHLENGHYNPSLVLAAKIAKVFNVTIEDMFIIIDE